MNDTKRTKRGRPDLGKVTLTTTMSPDGKAATFAMAAERGVTVGFLLETLVKEEKARIRR